MGKENTVQDATAWQRATWRHKLEFLGVSLAGWIVRLLPLRLLRVLARGLGSLVYACDARGRHVAEENLVAVFGGEMDAARRRRVARASYQSFARTMLELFWSPNLGGEVAASNIQTSGIDLPPGEIPRIFVTAHYSNFEWLGLNTGFHVDGGMTVAQKLRNPLLGEYFVALRRSTGQTVIPQNRAIARMLRHLKRGGYCCAVVDLNLDPKEASVIIDQFGGLKTCVTKLHAIMAAHLGAEIRAGWCTPAADGTYAMDYGERIEVSESDGAVEIAQKCWNAMERRIRDRPENWLWAYKHWRFKPSSGNSDRYPSYANTAPRFDRALAAQKGG
jgi:Kdo2-lipid IVA lauroyltransferase/acyltransferase